MLIARLFIIQSSSIGVSIVLYHRTILSTFIRFERSTYSKWLSVSNATKCTIFKWSSTAVNEIFRCDKRRNAPIYPSEHSLWHLVRFSTTLPRACVRPGSYMKRTINRMCIYRCLLSIWFEIDTWCACHIIARAGKEIKSFVDFINSFSLDTNWSTTDLTTTTKATVMSRHSTNVQHLLAGAFRLHTASLRMICHSSKNYYRNEI